MSSSNIRNKKKRLYMKIKLIPVHFDLKKEEKKKHLSK